MIVRTFHQDLSILDKDHLITLITVLLAIRGMWLMRIVTWLDGAFAPGLSLFCRYNLVRLLGCVWMNFDANAFFFFGFSL